MALGTWQVDEASKRARSKQARKLIVAMDNQVASLELGGLELG